MISLIVCGMQRSTSEPYQNTSPDVIVLWLFDHELLLECVFRGPFTFGVRRLIRRRRDGVVLLISRLLWRIVVVGRGLTSAAEILSRRRGFLVRSHCWYDLPPEPVGLLLLLVRVCSGGDWERGERREGAFCKVPVQPVGLWGMQL